MPSLIGSLFVSLTADFAPFQRNMQSAEGIVASTSANMRRNMGLTERSVSGLQRSMQSGIRPYALISAARTFDTVQQRANLLRGALFATTAAFGGLGAALTTNVVSRYLDSFRGLENRMRDVSAGSAELAANMGAASDVAERSRSSLTAVATLYTRLARSSPNEAPTNILRRVETINKALQLGGATAQEAASAAVQFSQAIQSNRLGGDELRAVLETPLGTELAKGMGITIGQLRKLSKEGKLTSDVLYKALDRISAAVDTRFAKSMSTIDQALTVADNKIITYAGSIDKAYGITNLITSAIGAFGNNLETIIPLLSQVGFGLGLLYAARRGPALGGMLSGPLAGFKALKAARIEDLRLAREEVAVAKVFLDKQQQSVAAARKVVAGDVTPLAPKSMLKDYQRDLAAVQKADADHLALLEQKGVVTTKLGEIYRTSTVGQIRASKALADQEEKVNQARLHRAAVGVVRDRADKQLFTAFGGGDKATIDKTKAAIADIEREEKAAIGRVIKEEERLETARASVQKQHGAAYAAAAQQRASVLVEEKRLTTDLIASEQRRVDLVSKLSTSRRNIQTTGTAEATRALRDAELAVRGAGNEYERAAMRIGAFERAARMGSIAVGALGMASRSLYAFLGGGWGVTIIAAATALEYFGSRAAEAAAKHQRFIDIVNEKVGIAAQGSGADSTEAQLSILKDKQKALNEELTITRDGYQEITNQVGGWINGMNEAEKTASELAGGGLNAFKMLFNEFERGNISIDTLISGTRNLKDSLPPKMFAALITSLEVMRDKIKDPTIALNVLKQELKDLDGQIFDVTIRLNTVEGDREQFVRDRNKSLAEQYRQYGAGQEAAMEETARQRKRKALLDAAGDTGDKALNTPTKIAAEGQRLLEEGYTKTREEANALATEELNLAEKTRLANKAAGTGVKDYENLANKIAELREQASGAFLSDLDQRVLDIAKSMKDGSAVMKEYIDAVNSGDFSKLSDAGKQLLEARDALMQINAADAYRDIIKEYGRGAQIAGQLADKQAELNFLVANGKITAEQATTAYTNFFTSFGQYEWIDKTSSAISDFASSAIEDFDNVGDAFKSLAKNLLRIAMEELVTKPLEQNLRNFFTAIVGGGNNAGPAPSGFNLIGALFGGAKGKSAGAAAGASVGSSVVSSVVGSVAKGGMSIYRAAIKGLESGGNYGAMGPILKNGSRALGAYQVMSNNLPSWSKEVFGKSMSASEFLKNPSAQDQIFDHFFGKSLAKYGNPQDAAAVWHSGSSLAAAKARNAQDVLGTTTVSYVDKFNAALGKTTASVVDMGAKTGSIAKSIGNLIGSNGFDYSKLLPQNGFKADPGGFAAMLGITGGTGVAGNGGFLNSLLGGISELIGGLFKGGGSLLSLIFGGIGSIFSLIFHGGGKVGATSAGRMVSLGAFAGAPRLHSGLKSDEFTSILQKGERVLTAREEAKTMATISGLSRRVGSRGGQNAMPFNAHFYLNGAISQKDIVGMVQGGIEEAVDRSKRSFPDWNIEYGKTGAFA